MSFPDDEDPNETYACDPDAFTPCPDCGAERCDCELDKREREYEEPNYNGPNPFPANIPFR